PKISRDKSGLVSLSVPDGNVEVYYTLDGTDPTKESIPYSDPFLVVGPTTVKAIAMRGADGKMTEVATQYFDVSKKEWQVLSAPAKELGDTEKMMDGDPRTFWAGEKGYTGPQEIVIDLGTPHTLRGFTYWPNQDRWPFGLIANYSFYVGGDNRSWERVAQGEFSNIKNNRIEQQVNFEPVVARYIKLEANQVIGDDPRASVAEIGILTQKK
ncbi:MAG: discoidin domain-containing protein, partial [Flavobacteriaceae bacterium]